MRGYEMRDDQGSDYLRLGVSPAPRWMCLIGRVVWIDSCPGHWALSGWRSPAPYSSPLNGTLFLPLRDQAWTTT